jgi:hypothetical protein
VAAPISILTFAVKALCGLTQLLRSLLGWCGLHQIVWTAAGFAVGNVSCKLDTLSTPSAGLSLS